MYMDVLSSKWLATQSILQSDRVNLAEHHIYGSSRLGMQKYLPDLLKYEYGPAITGSPYQSLIQAKPWYSLYGNDLFSSTVYNNSLSTSNMSTSGIGINTHVLGNRHYELTNHLGNVQATVLDRTTPVLGGVENTQLLGYHADISTAQDYYPFGMLMPGRYISDTDKHCVTINSTVLVSKDILATAGLAETGGVAYVYDGEPTPPPVWQLPIADDFEHEVLYLFHYIPAEEHPEGWVLHTNAEGGSVTYTVDLSSEPSGITSYFQLHPDTSQSEQQFGFGMELNEECQVEMRVRQYYNSDEGEYYEPIKWTTIRTGGDQNFVLPVDKNAVKAGGRTILELKYSSSNGDNFAQNIQVSVLTPWMHYYQIVPETRVVTICDEKDNYRFGFNGQEKDNEAKGLGNSLDFGARIYDSRLGRWLSVDPLTSKFPMLSPYQFASNTPIQAIDLDGLEAYLATEVKGTGHAFLVVKTKDELAVYTYGRYGAVDWNQTSGEGVLQRLSGAGAVDFINTELTRMDANFYKIGDVSAENMRALVDAKYNAGSASSVDGVDGRVIDDYSLFSSNCATHSCDWLIESGTDGFKESALGIDYNEDFVIPSSLQSYLTNEVKEGGKPIFNANAEMKGIVESEQAKEKLQGAGRSAESSGSSGRSSGGITNSSSSGSSSGRNTSSGSSGGSSSGGSSSGPVGSSSGASSGSSSGNAHSSSGSSFNNRK